MNREEFSRQVIEQIRKYLPEKMQEAELVIAKVQIGDQEREGFAAIMQGRKAAPGLDLESYYEDVKSGKDISDVIKELAADYTDLCEGTNIRIKAVNGTELVENLHLIAWNYKLHEKELQHIPHMRIHDLAVIPAVLFADGKSIPVHQELMQILQLSEETIVEKAMENHRKQLPPVLFEITEPPDIRVNRMELNSDRDLKEKDIVYFLSNDQSAFGAALIADKTVLEQLGEKMGESYYALPWSPHELMIIPESAGASVHTLKSMMRQRSKKIAGQNGFLSSSVYFYNMDSRELQMYRNEPQVAKTSQKKDDTVR